LNEHYIFTPLPTIAVKQYRITFQVICPPTHILRDAISLHLAERFQLHSAVMAANCLVYEYACVTVGQVRGNGSPPPGSWTCMLSPAGWLPSMG